MLGQCTVGPNTFIPAIWMSKYSATIHLYCMCRTGRHCRLPSCHIIVLNLAIWLGYPFSEHADSAQPRNSTLPDFLSRGSTWGSGHKTRSDSALCCRCYWQADNLCSINIIPNAKYSSSRNPELHQSHLHIPLKAQSMNIILIMDNLMFHWREHEKALTIMKFSCTSVTFLRHNDTALHHTRNI